VREKRKKKGQKNARKKQPMLKKRAKTTTLSTKRFFLLPSVLSPHPSPIVFASPDSKYARAPQRRERMPDTG
jgi:hypothetical protein